MLRTGDQSASFTWAERAFAAFAKWYFNVMAGLVPAIYVFLPEEKTWMRGTSPRMTIARDVTTARRC
jgi:hypothetical protein